MDADLSWCDVLLYVAGPGVGVLAAVLMSKLVEYVPRFESLGPKGKRLAFAGLCFIVPVVASMLGVLTCAWLFSWSTTFWPALWSGLSAVGAGTLVHTRELQDLRPQLERLVGELAAARAEVAAYREKDGGG